MKKYKLIKEYPSDCKLGDIAEWDNKIACYRIQNTNKFIGLDRMISYPEFWEEVVEKDYEILSLISNTNKIVKNIYNEHCVKALINKGFNIHSVKRLSDGEVFTVGDIDNFGKITGFEIEKNKIFSQYYNIGDRQWLSSLQYIKKPLFTTEDGVDIFEDDYCYFVRNTFKSVEEPFHCTKDFWKGNLEYYKWFSTKEKAEEYIVMNKPCLSINDVMNLLEFDYSDKLSENIERIKSNLTNFVKIKNYEKKNSN